MALNFHRLRTALRTVTTRAMIRAAMLPALLLTACATGRMEGEPSLAPRAAEAIDPRLPVAPNGTPAPADPALAGQLSAIRAAARDGIAAFDNAAPATQRLAAAAGPPQSESWIEAQQAVSALQALRGPLANAVAELDALLSGRIERWGGVSAADLAAIEAARDELGATNDRQAALVASLTGRLGS